MTKDLLIAALAVILFFLLLNREKFTNKETMVITKYDTIIKDLYECIKKIKGDITASKVAQVIKKSKIMKKN